MAKEWKHTFSKFYNWQTDDTFIPSGDKYLSSYNIDPVSNPRYLQLSDRITSINTLSTTANILEIVSLPGSATVYVWWNEVYYNSTNRTSVISGSSYYNAGFLYNTSSVMKVYVFDWTNVYRMTADLATKESTTAHAWGAVTAVTQATNTLVFAIGNKLYQIDNSWVISTALSTIPYWTTVKKLYFYNDLLYVFAQYWPDAVIYQCAYNGSSYNIQYAHTKEDVTLYDMAGSGGKMYWVSNIGLYQTSGVDSKKIKRHSFSSSVKCSIYRDEFLYMIDNAEMYRYWTSIPGFPDAFIPYSTHSVWMSALNWIVATTTTSGGSTSIVTLATRVPTTWEIITMPYDAGVLWAEKNLSVIEFAYELKTWKTGASIQIQIQTNLMELNNTATYINLRTLNTLSNATMRCRIDQQEILTALASENPDWQYARFKIILNWWDPDGSSLNQYSPKVYQDIMIGGSFSKDAEIYL